MERVGYTNQQYKNQKKQLKNLKLLLLSTACGLGGAGYKINDSINQSNDNQVILKDTVKIQQRSLEESTKKLNQIRTDETNDVYQFVKTYSDAFGLNIDDCLEEVYKNAEQLETSFNIEEDIFGIIYQMKFAGSEPQKLYGSKWSESAYQEYIHSSEGKFQTQIFKEYGLDPHLMIALEKAESGLDHENHLESSHAAWGITQQERTNFYTEEQAEALRKAGKDVPSRKSYNYVTGNTDSIPLLESNTRDFELNVRLGAMELSKALDTANYDIFYALDIYNKGKRGADEFRSGVKVTGNPNYIHDVLRYCPTPTFLFQIAPDTMLIVDESNGVSSKYTYPVPVLDETRTAAMKSMIHQYNRMMEQVNEIEPYQSLEHVVNEQEATEKPKTLVKIAE